MIVLGIESSCDETGLALYDSQKNKILSEALYSQISLHSEYGGVVPELASRDHIKKILPLYNKVLSDAQLLSEEIDAVAYTKGPGLIGALMVGATFAKTLSYFLKIPSIGVHHLEGHILAPMLAGKNISYPFITLLVSGGHTQLILANKFGNYEILGESLDDAVGESFDKTAKLMGLPYPGGPHLAMKAEQGVTGRFKFPRPMVKKDNLDFSFSGLKTAVITQWMKSDKLEQTKADICLAFQEAVVDTLCLKCIKAVKKTGVQNLIVAGGVSANKYLRQSLLDVSMQQGWNVTFPPIEYCTDNGAMIAVAGAQRLERVFKDNSSAILVRPRWPLEEINSRSERI